MIPRVAKYTGGSMAPTLMEEDLLLLSNTPFEHLRKGDIILFNGDDSVVCHRFYGVVNNEGRLFFLECGDNACDLRKRPAENYLGQVKTVLRGKEEVDLSRKSGILIAVVLLLMRSLKGLKAMGLDRVGFGLGQRLSRFKNHLLKRRVNKYL